jgi:amidase
MPSYVREPSEYDEDLFNEAVSTLRKAGAEVVEKIDIPSFGRPWKWNKVNFEFKHGVENYLQRLPGHLPIHSLSELINWNEENGESALKFGQDMLKYRDSLSDPLQNKDYILESITDLYFAQSEGIDYAINRYEIDSVIFPGYIGADLCARAGYPSVAVPAGYSPNGRPFGVTFSGTAFSEPILIRIAYSFEQTTKLRIKPIFS